MLVRNTNITNFYFRNIFFNFPPEKLVKKPPVVPKEVVQEQEIVSQNTNGTIPKAARTYPTPEEWINQPPQRTESRNTPRLAEFE